MIDRFVWSVKIIMIMIMMMIMMMMMMIIIMRAVVIEILIVINSYSLNFLGSLSFEKMFEFRTNTYHLNKV